MPVKEILATLKSLRNETMYTHHKKNGAGDNLFGAKLGDIRTLAKKIKINHELALSLWDTENIDARMLAILIIDLKKLSPDDMDRLVKSITYVQVADWFNSYIVKEYPGKEDLRLKWMKSPDPMAARAGWSLTSGRVSRDADGLDLPALLDRIETEMPKADPVVQWTMNTTLAQIGIHFPDLRKRALSIGEKLGVYRDFPVSKGCTSPFAPIWINEMVSRQK